MFEEITEYYTLSELLDEIENDFSSGQYEELIERLGLNGTLYVTESYHLKEHPMYGSSRLGVYKHDSLTLKWFHYKGIFDQEEGTLSDITYLDSGTTVTETEHFRRCRGQRFFELTNHLGNVLAVVTDRKLPQDSSANTITDYYLADIVSAQDYYPGGMQMPGRIFSASSYRYGFNGKESDNEWNGDGAMYNYGFRIYDPRIVRFLSMDPLFRTYPFYTPYQYAGNSPIAFIDLDGLERVLAITFNGEVNYRADKLELMNGSEISRKIITTNPSDQLVDAFKEASAADENGIGFVAIWGHGDAFHQWGDGTGALYVDDLEKLRTAIKNGDVKFTDNAIIYLGACNAGSCDPGSQSFAQKLADITDVTVIAGASDNPNDPNNGHRGSVGVKDESNGNMQYSLWFPKLDQFQAFEKGESPTILEGAIDLKPYLEKGTSMPLPQMPSRNTNVSTGDISTTPTTTIETR